MESAAEINGLTRTSACIVDTPVDQSCTRKLVVRLSCTRAF